MDNNNPYLNGGMPLNDSDLVKNASNVKSSLIASLNTIRKLHDLKMKQQTNVPALEEVEQTPSVNTMDTKSANLASAEYAKKAENLTVNSNNMENKFAQGGISANDLTESNKNDAFGMSVDGYIPEAEYLQNNNFEQYEGNTSAINNMEQNNASPAGEPVYVTTDEGHKAREKQKAELNLQNISADDVKKGRKVAWLAYILFFIPLLFAGKNPFVRFHANEGLEVNIVDVFGIGFILAGYLLKFENNVVQLCMAVLLVFGIVLIALTTLTKVIMIIMSLAGKVIQTPWFKKARIIK